MNDKDIQIIYKQLDEIKPYDRNPRQNDKAVDAVAKSIEANGFKVPMIVDRDGVIIAGHTRYKAAKQLGMSRVPCILADDLTPEQVKAFRIADNKTNELADWDDSLLKLELEDLQELDFDLSLTGFSDYEIDNILFGDHSDVPDGMEIDQFGDGDDEGETVMSNLLTFCGRKVPMTDEEAEMLTLKFESYADDNHTAYGFVNHLLGGN